MLKRSLKIIWFSIAACIILIALLSNLMRGLTPFLSKYHIQIEQFIAQALDQPIHIGRIEAGWHWFEPVLTLYDVDILQQGGTHALAAVDHLTFTIDLPGSIIHRRLQPSLLVISGGEFTVKSSNDGTRVSVAGFGQLNAETIADTDIQIFDWLFSQRTIALNDFSIRWIDKQDVPVTVEQVHLLLKNSGDIHSISGSAKLGQALNSSLQFAGSLQGTLDQLDDWQGQLYVQVQDILLEQWIESYQWQQIQVADGRLDVQLWLNINNSRFSDMQGEFHFANVNFHQLRSLENYALQTLSGRLMWRQEASGWRLDGEQIKIKAQDVSWSDNEFSYQIVTTPEQTRQQLLLQNLPLAEFSSLLVNEPYLPEKARQAIAALDLSGGLANINLTIVNEAQADPSWALSTDVQQLAWQSWGAIPPVSGINAQLYLAPDYGSLKLASRDVHLTMDNLFMQPLPLDTLDGQIEWQQQDNNWRISTEGLKVNTDILSANAQFIIDLPGDTSPVVDMNVAYEVSDLSKANVYFPAKKLGPRLLDWLNNAVVDSGSTDGVVLLRGQLADFPFDNQEGVFIVDSNLRDVDLNYFTGWPYARNVDVKLIFNNRNMQATVLSGLLSDLLIENVDVEIAGIGNVNNRERVKIAGEISADGVSVIDYIKTSPLSRKLTIFDNMQLTGPLTLDLAISIPLNPDSPESVEVAGDSLLQDNILQLDDWSIQLAALDGILHFSEQGLLDSDFTGSFLDAPIALNIYTDADERVTHIGAEGEVDMGALFAYMHTPILTYLQGQTQYQVDLKLMHELDNIKHMTVTSDLIGVAIDLPPPFAKTASQKTPLILSAEFAKGQDLFMQLDYDSAVSTNLHYESSISGYQLERGEIRFGSNKALLPNQQGLVMVGSLPSFSLSQWLSYFHDKAGESNSAVGQADFITLLEYADLRLVKADLWGQIFDDLNVKLWSQQDSWIVDLNNGRIDARIEVPVNLQQGLQAHLDYLYLAGRDNVDAASAPAESERDTLNPAAIPPLDINITNIYYDNKPLGKLALKTTPGDEGLLLRELTLQSPTFRANVSGGWIGADAGSQTILQGQIKVDDIAAVLAGWGMPSDLTSRDGNINFDLDWQSAPSALSYDSLEGFVDFEFHRGRIVRLSKETEEKLGLGKLLNVLSLQTLPRRLSLDFSDLTKKGYSYDTFAGHVNLQDGNANITGANLTGPVADLSVDGMIDLHNKTVDMIMGVSPRVTGSLPVVATIVGGPAVGAITWAAEKIVSVGMRSRAAFMYQVSGPWDDIKIEQVKK